MARIFSSGFELNSLTAGVEFDSLGSSLAISSATKRSGSYSGQFVDSNSYLEYDFSISGGGGITGTVYYRTYIYITTAPNSGKRFNPIEVYSSSGDPMVIVSLHNNRTITLEDGFNGGVKATSSVLNTGQFYRVELKVTSTTKASTVIDCRIDDVSIGTATIDLSGVTGNQAFFGINEQGIIGTTQEIYIDDIAINDSTTSFQNSWPGAEKLILLSPNAAGDANTFATQTGGTAGSSNNYTRVNEIPPNDATSFNGSNTLNQEDLFNMTDSGIGASDTVNVVHVGARFRNNVADAATAIKLEIEKAASGTISQSAAIVPNSTTWKTNATAAPFNYPLTLYQDPDNSNWTKTTIDSMQAGYKITTGGTNRIDVTALWVYVGYTPSTGPAVTGPFPTHLRV